MEKLAEKLVESQKQIMIKMLVDPYISKGQLADAIGVSSTSIDKSISKLKNMGLISRVGPDKGVYWKVNK